MRAETERILTVVNAAEQRTAGLINDSEQRILIALDRLKTLAFPAGVCLSEETADARVLVALAAATTGAALAQFQATDCGEVPDEECEIFLKPPIRSARRSSFKSSRSSRRSSGSSTRCGKPALKLRGGADPKRPSPSRIGSRRSRRC